MRKRYIRETSAWQWLSLNAAIYLLKTLSTQCYLWYSVEMVLGSQWLESCCKHSIRYKLLFSWHELTSQANHTPGVQDGGPFRSKKLLIQSIHQRIAPKSHMIYSIWWIGTLLEERHLQTRQKAVSQNKLRHQHIQRYVTLEKKNCSSDFLTFIIILMTKRIEIRNLQ